MTERSQTPRSEGRRRVNATLILAAVVALGLGGWLLSRQTRDAPTLPEPAPSPHAAAPLPEAGEPPSDAASPDAAAPPAQAVDAGTVFRDAADELAPSGAPGEAVVLPPDYVAPPTSAVEELSFIETLDVIEPVFDFARRQCGTVAFDVRDHGGVGEARFRDEATAACLGPILGPIGFPPPHLGRSGGSGSYAVRSTTAVEYEIRLVEP